MRKGIMLIVATILFAAIGTTWAMDDGLGVTVDATWVSKYIWRGFDVLDDKAAFQPSINLDLYGTGFSFTAWSSFAGASKNGGSVSTVDAEEWDYILTYSGTHEGTYRTDYALSYAYFDYPDKASKNGDLQEFNLLLLWPELCTAGIVPNYQVFWLWPAQGGGTVRDAGGFIHSFGLDYAYTVAGFLPDNPEQTFNLSWDIVYNDDAGAANVDHDWSHMVYGVSTDFACPTGGKITPAVYYQVSMEDTVNKQDEFWAGISYSMQF